MSSKIYLGLWRESTYLKYADTLQGESKLKNIPAFFSSLIKEQIRGDSLDSPYLGFINVKSIGHHIGYFETKKGKYLVNQDDGAVGERAGEIKPDYRTRATNRDYA